MLALATRPSPLAPSPSASFFPARPVSGGPFHLAPPKSGDWYYEPKYNGWRALVHVPTRTIFNRHGERMTGRDVSHFSSALDLLERAATRPAGGSLEWADCEALGTRNLVGRGTLVLLDLPELGRGPHAPSRVPFRALAEGPDTGTYKMRHRHILETCLALGLSALGPAETIPEHTLTFAPAVHARGEARGQRGEEKPLASHLSPLPSADPVLDLWQDLQTGNHMLGCEFFEGFVAKRGDSPYPLQNRSATATFPFWIKHRWRW